MPPDDLPPKSRPSSHRPLRRPPKEDLVYAAPSVDFSDRPSLTRPPRVSPAVPITATVDQRVSGQVLNVSVTGLLLEHRQALRPGSVCILVVAQGEAGGRRFRAQVIRSHVAGSVFVLGAQELLYQTGVNFLEGPAEEMWNTLTRSPGGSLVARDDVSDDTQREHR